jgi:hypothetical protein
MSPPKFTKEYSAFRVLRHWQILAVLGRDKLNFCFDFFEPASGILEGYLNGTRRKLCPGTAAPG